MLHDMAAPAGQRVWHNHHTPGSIPWEARPHLGEASPSLLPPLLQETPSAYLPCAYTANLEQQVPRHEWCPGPCLFHKPLHTLTCTHQP
jgi:hypothetical protein